MIMAPHQDEQFGLFSKTDDLPEEELTETQERFEQLSESIQEEVQIEQKGSAEQDELQALVTRALLGDHNAFGVIVDQYSTLMFHTALMIVGDRDTAEDLVQDALIQAWHHLADLRKVRALRPWLIRIVINQCISFKRRLARTTAFMRHALAEQETDLIAQAADDYKGRMERDWDLAHTIELLPPKQRVVIVLHYYNGMTLPEMAQALHTSENTLKKRIQAALTNLRRMLCANDEPVTLQRKCVPSAA
jgi:RNA polymerase sigma-70 factor (ECF subfamily)